MKKIQNTILVYFLAVCTLAVSCKKEDEISPKDITQNLLVKKWYYHNYTSSNEFGSLVNISTAFTRDSNIEFFSNGTFLDTYVYNTTQPFTISVDGKTITTTTSQSTGGGTTGESIIVPMNITKISETELELNFRFRNSDRYMLLKSIPR